MYALIWLAGYKFARSAGLWIPAFPGAPERLALVPLWAFVFGGIYYFGVDGLVAWRVIRRWGSVSLAVGLPAVGVLRALRDRAVGIASQTMVPANAIALVVDGLTHVIGLACALAVMRMIAGPANKDALSRKR